MMSDVVGQDFIFAVAQRPFERENVGSGTSYLFCTLLPLFNINGGPVSSEDFPDNGDVWWMVLPNERGFAEPGRLVTGKVEDSVKKGEPGFSQFQVVLDTLDPLRGQDYVEILTLPPGKINKPRDLVTGRAQHTMDHPPLELVHVKWQGKLLGPLRTVAEERPDEPGRWNITFSPEMSEDKCSILPADTLSSISPSRQLKKNISLSLDDRPIHESYRKQQVSYHLIESNALNDYIGPNAEIVSIRSDNTVIRQLAKRILTRKKRQQLVELLTEMEAEGLLSNELSKEEDKLVLDSLRTNSEADIEAVASLTRAIVDSNLIRDQLDAEINKKVDQHVEDNAARLQTNINKRIEEKRVELERLQKEQREIQNTLKHLETTKKEELEREMARGKEELEQQRQQEQARAEKERVEIDRQRKALRENLEKVADKLAKERDEVVNQFLTISPLLEEFRLLPGATGTAAPNSTTSAPLSASGPPSGGAEQSAFRLPAFNTTSSNDLLAENAFYDRFKTYVKNRGFQYREIDLLAFHISVKCSDLTILGGLPGTGKSSLARLYGEAMEGEKAGSSSSPHFLHVAVSPAWMDMRDLVGHFNALNNTFQPADSGLFQHLVIAQAEYAKLSEDSEMYLVCLDEMNLAHVEHYFSGFLQVLEHPNGQRLLRCFAENIVNPANAFANYATVHIPHSMRFIGTVNFDETTKQLSQRLLDRADLIRLPSERLPLELEEASSASISGPPVRVRDYQSWISNTATFSDKMGELIDELREYLRVLNCPMNPRRFSAMRRFIASWPPSLPYAEKALDLQIAQRVITQIRGLYLPTAKQALESIRKILEKRGFEESLRILDEISRVELADFTVDEELEL